MMKTIIATLIICLCELQIQEILGLNSTTSHRNVSLVEYDVDIGICTEHVPQEYVSFGCCSLALNSHCFFNDEQMRNSFCETQNLHNRKFDLPCIHNQSVDFNTTCKGDGSCFCCSEKYPAEEDKPIRPPSPPPDDSYCGHLDTSYFGNYSHILAHIYKNKGWGPYHFKTIRKTAAAGKKDVAIFNPSCKISICGLTPGGSKNCSHFLANHKQKYVTGNNFEITSISCGCKAWESECGTGKNECPAKPEGGEDLCAVLYQEENCTSCYFGDIPLLDGGIFTPSNYAIVRSLTVKDGCWVTASSETGQDTVFSKTNSSVPEFYKIPKCGYSPFVKFECKCPSPHGLSGGIIALIVLGAATITTLPCIGLVLRYKRRKVTFTKEETEELRMEMTNGIAGNNLNDDDSSLGGPLSLKREGIKILKDELLGKGNFGSVYRGKLTEILPSAIVVLDVAIKTVDKTCAKIEELKLFINEICIMASVGQHANIVSFLGYYCNFHPKKWEFLCVMEVCNGNLLDYLRASQNSEPQIEMPGYVSFQENNTTDNSQYIKQTIDSQQSMKSQMITIPNMFEWCAEIADGMEYLASKNVVHIDLAARNILISNDPVQMKISDFGLSKKLYETLYYKKSQNGNMWLPMKWSAYESLMNFKFSPQSDIWSYGIVCWEIFSLGQEPYQDIDQVLELIRFLNCGNRLPRPDTCDEETYSLLAQCWDLDPAKRPTFSELSKYFYKNNDDLTELS